MEAQLKVASQPNSWASGCCSVLCLSFPSAYILTLVLLSSSVPVLVLHPVADVDPNHWAWLFTSWSLSFKKIIRARTELSRFLIALFSTHCHPLPAMGSKYVCADFCIAGPSVAWDIIAMGCIIYLRILTALSELVVPIHLLPSFLHVVNSLSLSFLPFYSCMKTHVILRSNTKYFYD